MAFSQTTVRDTRKRALVVLVCSLALLSGCDKLNLRSDADYLERARALEAKGDYSAAIVEAKNALQKNTQNVDARLLLGNAYLQVGNGAEAEIALKRALEGGADEQTTNVSIARSILLQGDLKRVLADVTVPPNAVPSLAANILAIRGEAQFEMGRYAEAGKSFDAAVAKDPTLAEAIVGQARIALATRQYDKAAALVQQVLDRTPKDFAALIVQADIARTRGDYDKAAAMYQNVVALDPRNLVALVSLTSMELGSNRLDEAAKHIAVIREFQGAEVMSLYLQAFLDFRKQNFLAARESVQKVLGAAPENLQSLVLAGVNEFALNANEQAEKYLRQALSISPNLVIAKRVLISTYARTGQIPQALELLKAAVLQTPDDPAIMSLAGETYMKVGDFATASKYLARAAELTPANTDARARLGLSRLAAGQPQAALGDLETAIQGEQQSYQADMLLIVAYMNLKDYAGAGRAVEELAQKQPDNPLTYNFKGGLLLATKDVAGARAAFEKSLSINPDYVPAAINLAKLDLAERKVDDAKKRFTTILAKNPRMVDATVALVDIQRAGKAPSSEIVATLERAVAADPTAVKALVPLTRELVSRDPAKALTIAKQAAAISPNDSSVLEALGAAQLAGGEQRAALATYTKLVDQNPKSPTALFRLASLLNDNANPAAAARLLRKALEIQPDYIEAQVALVSLELNAGNVNEALRLARRIEVAKPQSPFGFLLEGDAMMATKAYAKAATSYEKAYALSRSGALAIKVYAAYNATGQEAQGLARLQDWLKQQPEDVATRYFLATAAAGKRDYKLAIAEYQLLLQKDPANAVVLNDLANAYDQVKDPRALATAEAAYKANANEAPIKDTLGWILVQRGDTAKGVTLLRDAARTAPQAVEIRMHLVQGLLNTGDKDAARVELEGIVNRRENFPQRKEAERLLASLQPDG